MTADKPDVLFARPLYSYSLDEVAGFCSAHKLWEAEDPDALLSAVAPTCRAAVTRAVFTEDWMAKLPNLGLIAVCGVGYEGVDIEAALKRGIVVTHTPDVLTEEVADYGVALLLAAARRIVAGDRYVRQGHWSKDGAMSYGQRFHGKRLGILGLGRIGIAVARRCEAFGMEIGYHNRNKRDDVAYTYFEDAVALGKWADYFIVITPGGEGTRHLVDASVMNAIGPEGILVNVGRGPTVDDKALAAALSEGRLGMAALDVFADEPNVPEAFFALKDQLILQPHQASATHATRRAMSQLCMDNVQAFLDRATPLTPVPESK
jgi:lactate dehydrogenase-like 2-hydroxyacid dehydrogenase